MPVVVEIKLKIINWLHDLCLIKENNLNLVNDLPYICKDAVIFSDLINRINGKNEVIKGIYRLPCNINQIRANINKILLYLSNIDRINPRYL